MFFALLLSIGLTSCKKYFEGVNDNPNQPETVSLDMILPTAQAQLAYGNGGDLTRLAVMLTQQARGIDRCSAMYRFFLTENDMDNWWRFNMYGGALMNLKQIEAQATAEEHSQYRGISKILMAYGMMVVTDFFGDVPYSEAFQGVANTSPAWDSQESIYNAVFTLLEEAKTDLGTSIKGVPPSNDDLIHNGDLNAWLKTAQVIEARAYLHLGKVAASNYQNALDALGVEGVDSYGSEADNASLQFGSAATEAGPMHQFIHQRNHLAFFDAFINDFMQGQGDPRYPIYFDELNAQLGEFFERADAFFYFATYTEQKFIEAEAAFQTGDLIRAADAHNAAVMASLGRFSLSDSAFEAAHAQHTSASINLQEIMEQKYVALFLEAETFTDWRRTGFPNLVAPVNNVTGGVIPRRLPYPQSERLYNGANFQDLPLTSRVWWDVP